MFLIGLGVEAYEGFEGLKGVSGLRVFRGQGFRV